MCGVRDRTKE
jgi:hypothetical protein